MNDTVKIRLWGHPTHVARAAARLRQRLDVVEESRDYRDRNGGRIRRYLVARALDEDGKSRLPQCKAAL
jgi:hypothetical protein